jgi:hypothetical protein
MALSKGEWIMTGLIDNLAQKVLEEAYRKGAEEMKLKMMAKFQNNKEHYFNQGVNCSESNAWALLCEIEDDLENTK